MKHTFEKKYPASTLRGIVVTIPDQVGENRRAYEGRGFPVIREDGDRSWAIFLKDLYKIDDSGTVPIVRIT